MTTIAKSNFKERPMVVIWETTQSCDLACVHCRACAQPKASPFELSTAEAEKLIDGIAELKPSVFVLTGGDPLKRVDIHYLASYAVGRGLRPALTPSATPLLTRSAIHDLKDCNLSRIALSLDGATPEKHDAFRGVSGSFARTMEAIHWSNEAGLPVQINTTVTLRNMYELDEIASVLKQLKIVLWSVFFVVPTGRAGEKDLPSGSQFEQIFAKLYRLSGELPFHIKTTEAPHYRRFVAQQRMAATRKIKGGNESIADIEGFEQRRAWVNDGKGSSSSRIPVMFFPAGFCLWPLGTCGAVRCR
ncbi:MAG: Fe-S protein radical family [Acidobacteriales bacterium]|nr:Fe-S protein radical family [Terriglobales bacterium]